MSAKKKEKVEWVACSACGDLIPWHATSAHERCCVVADGAIAETSLPTSDLTPKDIRQRHTKISKDVLTAIIKLVPKEETSRLPPGKIDIAVLNPVTLKLCGLSIAGSIMLTSCLGKKTCCTAWPSSSVPIDVVYVSGCKLQSLQVDSESLVAVNRDTRLFVIANQVTLQSRQGINLPDDPQLHSVILQTLNGTSLHCGDVLRVCFEAKERHFDVVEISGDFGTQWAVSQSSIGGSDNLLQSVNGRNLSIIEEQLSALNLTSSNSELYDCSLEKSSPSASSPNSILSERHQAVLEPISRTQFVYKVSFSETKLLIKSTDASHAVPALDATKGSLSSIGGLDSQISLLKDLVERPLKYPDLYIKCGISLPTGILLYGPSGTGKTMLAQALALGIGVKSVSITGPELTSKFYGETESRLREMFDLAAKLSPCLVIVDDLDSLCPTRTDSSSETDKRVVSTLMSIMDNLNNGNGKQVVVVATTNRIDLVDAGLRRPGRFDCEIEIGVPNAQQRLDILRKLLLRRRHMLSEDELVSVGDCTHGYVGADLAAVCKEAAHVAMKRLLSTLPPSPDTCLAPDFAADYAINQQDLRQAMTRVRPSAMRSVMVDIPKVHWCDVGGQEDVKQKLKEAIEWPLLHRQAFARIGITAPRGVLMYGPPGCSKTMMAKALATESGLNFISIKGPELFSKFLGESEKAVRDVFRKARVAAPSIVFFDEIDALGVQRSGKDSGSGNVGDRVLAQILTEMDGVEGLDGVVVVAATNRPDVIDPALLRPGRLDRLIYVPLPDFCSREEIFRIQFRKVVAAADVDILELARASDGYSGAEICSLVREAAIEALREDIQADCVCSRHFESVFRLIKPRTSKQAVEFYNNFLNGTKVF